MRIGVFGAGYVGLVTALCFAEMDNDVLCADVDVLKINQLKKGISPIYEEGIELLLRSQLTPEKIRFTDDLAAPIEFADILFLAVGTPTDISGVVDLESLYQIATLIGDRINKKCNLVIKSTVPVGTTDKIKQIIERGLSQRNLNYSANVVVNPEFLREGTAISDFRNPSRIIIGASCSDEAQILLSLYKSQIRGGSEYLLMDPKSAEISKYAANAFLATKISFINELSKLCEAVGGDIEEVRNAIGSDPRIGREFLRAGLGYGGSCLPKDIRALLRISEIYQQSLPVISAAAKVNKLQITRLAERASSLIKINRPIAVWGLSFKPGTDDVRESPALMLINLLLQRGHHIRAFDPIATENAKAVFSADANITFLSDPYEALRDCELLVVTTEWPIFLSPDFKKMKLRMSSAQILDTRNIYSSKDVISEGFDYHSVGRSS